MPPVVAEDVRDLRSDRAMPAGYVGGATLGWRRAGERVMASVSRFLTTKLRLTVNEAKSAVARPEERTFLGFSISKMGASGASRQKPSINSRRRSGTGHAGHGGSACRS